MIKMKTLRQTGSKYQTSSVSCDVTLAPDATRGKQAKLLITLTVRHEAFKLCFIACLEACFEICVSNKGVYIACVLYFELFRLQK